LAHHHSGATGDLLALCLAVVQEKAWQLVAIGQLNATMALEAIHALVLGPVCGQDHAGTQAGTFGRFSKGEEAGEGQERQDK